MTISLHILASALLLLWPFSCLAFDPAVSTEFSLEQGSSYCMDCHNSEPVQPMHKSHPVDVDYSTAQSRSRGKLKPLGALDPAILLKNGQMVCTSCHHPDSLQETKLVLSNVDSRLCLACHNL